MARHRRNNNIQNSIKDYLVPIIWGLFLLFIIIKIFTAWDTSTPVDQSVQSDNNGLDIVFSGDTTEAYVSYNGEDQKQISDDIDLYAGETITVSEWQVQLKSDNSEVSLNKLAKFVYNAPLNYSLASSDAWIHIKDDTKIAMRYLNITATNWAIISLSQNEALSTVYVLSWSAKIENLSGVSTILPQWEKLSISKLNASKTDVDLSSEKTNIDSFFKSSDWFLDNNWHIILENNSSIENDSSTWASITEQWDSSSLISFNALYDEMSTEAWSINIKGTISSEEISAITINNKQTSLSIAEKTFQLDNLALISGINDIVVKIFNTDKDIIEKKVFTVYSSGWSTETTSAASNNTNIVNSQWVTTYQVDANDFGFTLPSVTGKFTTSGSEVTIRGITTAEWITKVEVNGFQLWSFNGSTWRYHAFERFETLEEWTNQYKVDYYNDTWIVYTDYYTIVKQSNSAVQQSSVENTISNEAQT